MDTIASKVKQRLIKAFDHFLYEVQRVYAYLRDKELDKIKKYIYKVPKSEIARFTRKYYIIQFLDCQNDVYTLVAVPLPKIYYESDEEKKYAELFYEYIWREYKKKAEAITR